MDTRNFETKQGAATTADLPQQETHEGVADLSHPLLLQIRRDWLQASPRNTQVQTGSYKEAVVKVASVV
jgi:hypothetical protein